MLFRIAKGADRCTSDMNGDAVAIHEQRHPKVALDPHAEPLLVLRSYFPAQIPLVHVHAHLQFGRP